jgi:formylmethanofuran dehydrogenase subunit D
MTDDQNLTLYVATYAGALSAQRDFESLEAAEGDDVVVEGAVALARAADGKVSSKATVPLPRAYGSAAISTSS